MAIARFGDPYLYGDRQAMEEMYRQKLEHGKMKMRKEIEILGQRQVFAADVGLDVPQKETKSNTLLLLL